MSNKLSIRCIASATLAALVFAGAVTAGEPAPPEVRIETVTDLGTIGPPPGIHGRDGGYSAKFGGKAVWVYGDTIVPGRIGQEPELIGNSWSWTGDLEAADGIDGMTDARDGQGVPLAAFSLTPEEKRYNQIHSTKRCGQAPCAVRWALWPGALVADPAGGRLLAFYEKVFVGPEPLDFKIAGHAIAVWNDIGKPARRPVAARGEENPSLMFTAAEPGFGSAALVSGESLFVFGCDREGAAKPCRLARVPLESALDRKAWRFYSARDTWTEKVDGSRPVFTGNDILSVSYNPYLRCFLAVYARPMTRSVVFRTARALPGSWSAPIVAFEAKPPASETGWIYDALEHPEYAAENGRVIYVTYSRQIGPESFEQRLVAVSFCKNASPP